MDNKKNLQKVGWLIVAVVMMAVSIFFGVTYPIPEAPTDEVVVLGTTNFDTVAASDVTVSDDLTVTDDSTLTDDVSIGGDLSVTGGMTLDNVTQTINAYENLGGLPTVISATISYTPTSGTVATIGDGEVWLVQDVFVNVTTNYDCTGDDCTLTVGDGNDADGFIVAADANIQAAFTEATGYPAGWYGLENGSNGAYTVDDGVFLYAPSGAAETIDYAVGGTSPAGGAATIYVVYYRLK